MLKNIHFQITQNHQPLTIKKSKWLSWGAYSDVYKTTTDSGLKSVLKVIKFQVTNAREQECRLSLINRLFHEINALHQRKQLMAIKIENDRILILQRLIPGKTLSKLLSDQNQSLAMVNQSVEQALMAVLELQRQGYCHCDLSSFNILYVKNGQTIKALSLIDFGYARPYNRYSALVDYSQLYNEYFDHYHERQQARQLLQPFLSIPFKHWYNDVRQCALTSALTLSQLSWYTTLI